MFLYTISCMQGGHTTLTLIFIVFYMTAALLQVRTGRDTGGGRGQGCPAGMGGEAQAGPLRHSPRLSLGLHRCSGEQAVVPAQSLTYCVTLAS